MTLRHHKNPRLAVTAMHDDWSLALQGVPFSLLESLVKTELLTAFHLKVKTVPTAEVRVPALTAILLGPPHSTAEDSPQGIRGLELSDLTFAA
jgi:hypothetical protein